MRTLVNNALDDMHRPALPYKFKFKVSGCPNDCMNSVQRADFGDYRHLARRHEGGSGRGGGVRRGQRAQV